MKRTTLTASLVGAAAAGLITAAIATPAFSQATTYPEGTDCSAIQNSANRTDCISQMNESRQNPNPGDTQTPGTNNASPPDSDPIKPGGEQPGNSPVGGASGSSGTEGTGSGGGTGSGAGTTQ